MRFKANISVAALCCVFLMSVMLAFAACDKNRKEPEYIPNPVVEISFDRFQGDGVLLSVRSINTDAVYGIARKMSEPAPEAEEIVEEGTSVEDGDLFIGGLEKEVEYTVYLDVLFLVNWLMDIFLLYITGKFLKEKIVKKKLRLLQHWALCG